MTRAELSEHRLEYLRGTNARLCRFWNQQTEAESALLRRLAELQVQGVRDADTRTYRLANRAEIAVWDHIEARARGSATAAEFDATAFPMTLQLILAEQGKDGATA